VIGITLGDPEATLGDFMEGTVVHSEVAAGDIVVRLRWQTYGRATHDAFNVVRVTRHDLTQASEGGIAFRWKIPHEGPMTFHGIGVGVEWTVEAELNVRDAERETAMISVRVRPPVGRASHHVVHAEPAAPFRRIGTPSSRSAWPVLTITLAAMLAVFIFFSRHVHYSRQILADWYQAEEGYDAAVARQAQTHEPLLLYFGSSSCQECIERLDTLFNSADTRARLTGFIKVQMNGNRIGRERDVARLYDNVDRFGLVVVRHDGTWKRVPVFDDDDLLLDEIRKIPLRRD
jgi:hypothetical protein